MVRALTALFCTISLLASHAFATPDDLGTFASPAPLARPRFRYWLPDASVSPSTVRKDILSASSIGAGGVEFLPFYNYGGELGGAPPGADWSTYNFGTEASNKLLVAAKEAHREGGLRMDFALGPNQGQGVPAEVDDEGLQWDLVCALGNAYVREEVQLIEYRSRSLLRFPRVSPSTTPCLDGAQASS